MGKLERLIATLTKNEKAYYKRWIPSSDKEKKFIRVFDHIDKNPTTSSQQLLAKLSADTTQKKLETLKAHLWSSLLLSLRDYHRKNDLQLQFNSRTDAIKVLRLKGQFEVALKNAEALLNDCEAIGMLPEAMRAIEHIENIQALNGRSDTETENAWIALYEKKERLALQIAESSRIRSIERRLKLLNDRLGDSLTIEEHRQKVEMLAQQLNKCGINDQASVDAKFRFYQIQAIVSRIFQNRNAEEKWFKQVFLLLDNNPNLTNTYYTAFYAVALHNYLDALLHSRKFDAIPELLQRMELWLDENPKMVGRDLYFFANDTLAYHIIKEEYGVGLKHWERLESQLTLAQPPWKDLYIRFATLGAVLCLWNGEYRRGLSILRAMFQELGHTTDSDTLTVSKALEVIFNFELEDVEHTEHLIGAYLRSMNKDDRGIETLTIKTISRSLQPNSQKKELWTKLAKNLEECLINPDEQLKLLTFDFVRYAKMKAE